MNGKKKQSLRCHGDVAHIACKSVINVIRLASNPWDYRAPDTYFVQSPDAQQAVHDDEEPLERPVEAMYRSRHHRQSAKALTDPDAQHVQFEERVVDRLAAIYVHEEVVQEAAAPWSHRTDDVAPGQEAVVVPHQLGRHRR